MIVANQVCTFYLDTQMYGVPVESVQEVIRYQHMTDVPLAPTSVVGLINLRGQIVTAIDLRRRLGIQDRPTEQLPMNVVVRGEDGAISFLVDQIGDVQQIDQANLEPLPDTLEGSTRDMISGAYKMKDQLLLILDTERAMNVTSPSD
jgi:purine-binding chemotaxis protein CheW